MQPPALNTHVHTNTRVEHIHSHISTHMNHPIVTILALSDLFLYSCIYIRNSLTRKTCEYLIVEERCCGVVMKKKTFTMIYENLCYN